MTKSVKSTALSRRQLLGRIGLAAGATYMAPALAGMNAARASGASGGGSSGGASGGSSRGASGASGNSRASRNSTPSRSAGSQARGNRIASDNAPDWMRRMLGI